MPGWRDPSNEDKRPLRTSEVFATSLPRQRTFLSSISPVFFLLLILGVSGATVFFLYDHQQKLSALSARVDRTEQEVSGRPEGTGSLKQAFKSIRSLEARMSSLEAGAKDIDQKIKSALEPLHKSIDEIKLMLKQRESRKSNADDNE